MNRDGILRRIIMERVAVCWLGTAKSRSSRPLARLEAALHWLVAQFWCGYLQAAAAAAPVLRQQTPAHRQEPTRLRFVGEYKGPRRR